ncbi:MAG: hypothetical protein GX242_04365 [Clostridiales bacterium]|nr:hypothetical protein [Clostridiales bacterium]
MTNKRKLNGDKSKEVEFLDDFVLQLEIMHTLKGLDSAYARYANIFDKAILPTDSQQNISSKK